jgi:hypothetical protein
MDRKQKITKRFNELTDDEQRFFNRYINAVASGGFFEPIALLRGLVNELPYKLKKERERDYAIMKNIIRRLARPDLYEDIKSELQHN